MSSSPTNRDWIELLDGELDADREDALLDALIADPDQIDELAADEAALVYALGGLADGDQTATEPRSRPRRLPRIWFRAAAVAAALLIAVSTLSLRTDEPAVHDGERRTSAAEQEAPRHATPAVSAALSRLEELERRLAALDDASTDSEAEILALAALGGARARLTSGEPDLARARLREVIRDFPDSSAARTASHDLVRLEER